MYECPMRQRGGWTMHVCMDGQMEKRMHGWMVGVPSSPGIMPRITSAIL